MFDTLTTLPQPVKPGTFLLVAFGFIAAEYLYTKLSHHDDATHHDEREILASLGIAIGDIVVRVVTGGLVAIPFFWLYKHRLLDIPMTSVWAWLAAILAVEFCYYVFHRASHRVRWLWATHAVHHSATHFNLSAAIRLGWTGQLTGAFVFFLPLAWIGLHPLVIVALIGIGLLYQFFLHTSLNVHLGPLEWVLNTPAHHRVHHASNEGCLDKNYGSMLIIFDRLFGTFATAPRNEPLTYGLKGRERRLNPFAIAFGEWVHLYRDVRSTPGMWRKLRLILGPP